MSSLFHEGEEALADLAVHRVLEQDRTDHLFAGECMRGGDAGPHEDDHAIDLFSFQDPGQGIQFMQAFDLPEMLADLFHCRGFAFDPDLDRVL